jgi:hypothetical protein
MQENTNDILHKTRKKQSKIHMEAQKTPNIQRNLEQKRKSWWHHNS